MKVATNGQTDKVPPLSPGSAAQDKIDAQELLLRVDGDMACLADLVQIFFAELPQYRDGIAAAIADGNSHALQHAAHSLKSMLGILAAHDAQEVALRLEKMGLSGELAGARTDLSLLDHELDLIRPVLAGLLALPGV